MPNSKGLLYALTTLPADTAKVETPDAKLTPGYFAVLAAHLKRYKITADAVHFNSIRQLSYSQTIKLQEAVWSTKGPELSRPRLGKTYSPIVHLCSAESVNEATSQINDCIRNMVNAELVPALGPLFSVIGELHDNVWSHGLNSGFSTAQKNHHDESIEFCLADCGIGLLEELKSKKINVARNHQEAIEWCIQEGNSSKLLNAELIEEDEWAQSMPNDHVGSSPFGKQVAIKARSDGNNHQGLGLAKTIQLVNSYKAELILATGNCALHIKSNGEKNYLDLPHCWRGVAISIKINRNHLADALSLSEQDDNVNEIINLFRRQ